MIDCSIARRYRWKVQGRLAVPPGAAAGSPMRWSSSSRTRGGSSAGVVAGAKAYQYTALDDCTRLRVLRLYRQLNVVSSLDFLAEMVRTFPFAIRKIQTDRGAEFPFASVLAVERRGIRHRYIRPRCPEQNGKMERSHRVDHEEFWSRQSFERFEAAAAALRDWERVYNELRFSMALNGRTPAEKLAAVLAAA